MTYQEAYQKAEEILCIHGIEEAKTDAWILLEYVTGMNRTRYFVDGFREMPKKEEDRFLSLIERRSCRIPVQHLTGVQEFMGLEFLVNEHVLVPRQDTEILVEAAEKKLQRILDIRRSKTCGKAVEVLDMCTGSGCIPISLKVRNPGIQIQAADISEKALEVAAENAKKWNVEVEFSRSDMFGRIQGKFDLITSNPPYIPTAVISKLAKEVRLHDPFEALDGREDGLYFYRILAKESPRYLKDGGWLFLEIGYDQSEAVESLLKENGFAQVGTQKDLAGLDRVVSGVYNRHSVE